jgi:hypothetical protein
MANVYAFKYKLENIKSIKKPAPIAAGLFYLFNLIKDYKL